VKNLYWICTGLKFQTFGMKRQQLTPQPPVINLIT